MTDLFFGPVATWFTIPAIVGTTFFTLRMALMLIGGDADGMDVDVDAGDIDAGDGGESSHAFEVLSMQAIAAFLMGFGWGALGAYSGSGWSVATSLIVGTVAGSAMVWTLGSLLKFVYGLQSSGNVALYQALESEGSVYTQIPESGTGSGQVKVLIGERERYYKALSSGGAIPTGAKIRVVSVDEGENTVTVTEA